MARTDYLTTADLLAMDTRELNTTIKGAYSDAQALLERITAEATGSGTVLDASGTGTTPRIIGSTEMHGHLARHPHHFTVPTIGNYRDRLDAVVAGWRGQVIGRARACERRAAAIRTVRKTLAARAAAAGLDPDSMLSAGTRIPMGTVARRLVDIAIDRIEYLHQGDQGELVRAALAMVPDDAFAA